MPTTLLQDASLLAPEWQPWSQMEGVGTLFEEGEISDIGEDWGPNGVTVSATLSIEQPEPISIGGFDVIAGEPDSDDIEFGFSLTLDSDPLFAAVSVILLAKGVVTVEDVERTAEKLDIDPNALNLQQNPEYFHDIDALGRVRAEFDLPEAHVLLPKEHLRVGRRVTQDGSTVGIEPDPDDPRPSIKLADPNVVADTQEGVSASLGGPQDVTLPPLLIRGSDIALEFEEIAPDLSTTSGHPSVTSMDGYDDSWQGLYVGKTVVWGLDELLPFLPDHLDSSAGGSRLTFSDWLIDENGATGTVSLVIPPSEDQDGLFQLREFSLGFDRDWIPANCAADVDLDLSTLSNDEGDDFGAAGDDGVLTLGADLRYDPAPESPPARFGFDIVVRGGDDGAFLDLDQDDLGSAAPVVFAVVAGLTAPFDSELSVVMASMASLEARGDLETQRITLDELSFNYDTEERTANGDTYWARVLTTNVTTSVESRLTLDAVDIDTPLGLGLHDLTVSWVLNHGELAAAGATEQSAPVAVSWGLENVGVTLSANADLANVVTITDIGLRKANGEFLIELGVEASGSGDVAISGLPDAVVIAFHAEEPDVGDYKEVRLKQGGQQITILAPGALYASGEMTTGEEAIQEFPEPDQGEWKGGMIGSLQAFLVGNGTASTPAEFRERSSYQFTFDIDLLSAQSTQGWTTLVVTIDGTFTPGIPLGQSGAALYGLGLLYAQNAQPALPSDSDLADWYMDEPPEYTTDAPKWEPKLDEWGFGASVVLGSAPDEARSWSAKAGLFLMLPGPVIMIAGTADTFSEKPSLGGGASPPFAAVIVLDFENDVFSIDLEADLTLPEDDSIDRGLVDLKIPVELFVDLQNPEEFYLYFGQYQPENDRVTAKALGMLDISAYLMLDGRTIAGLPIGDLPGLALALGGEAQVKWGLDADVIQCYLYAEAGFHLGVSLAEPAQLVGLVRLEGGLVVKVFGFGPELGVYAKFAGVAPDPFELTGEVGVDISLPWPLEDINTSVDFTFGPGGDLPDAPNPIEGVTAHSRYEKKPQELSASDANDPVPVDPVFTLGFDAPVGNESGTVGSFDTGGNDTNDPVWKVVNSSKEEDDDGVEKRHRVGYRYELTDVSITEVREDGADRTLSDKPATWDPKVTSGGNTQAARDAKAATASGGMPARNTLQLLDAEKSHTNKHVGTAAKLTRETEASWDPCTTERGLDSATYHAGKMPTGRLDDAAEELTPAAPESPPAYGLAVPQTTSGRMLQRQGDFYVLPTTVKKRPWSEDQISKPALKRPRFLCVPQAVGRSERAVKLLLGFESRPCGALDIAVPENDEVTVRLLLGPTVKLTALPVTDGEVAGEPLEVELIESLFGETGQLDARHDAQMGWGIYEVTVTTGVDVVRMWALRADYGYVDESLEPFTASILDVTVDIPGQAGDAANVEADAMNDLYGDLLNAKLNGEAPGVLKPDTKYEIAVTVEATHAEQWGEASPEFSGTAGTHSRSWTVQTDSEPPDRLRATDDPDGSKDTWDVAMTPRDNAPAFYRGEDVELEFRRERTLAAFEAHDSALAVRLVDEQGNDQFDAVDVTDEVASKLPPTAAEWRDALSDVPCLNVDPVELYRKGSATIESLLDPGVRYIASLHVVDENAQLQSVDFDDEDIAPVVHSWRFTASDYLNAGEHLAAHEPVDELTESAPDEQSLQSEAATHTQSSGVTVNDEGLDTLLYEEIGLPPRRAPDEPEVVRIWRWQPASDDADPLALLLDGPEPIARADHELSVHQNGRELDGRFLTRSDRARVLFVPDAGELTADADCTIELQHDNSTEHTTVSIPVRPAPLQSTGVIP